MDLRFKFNEDAANYDKARPSYPNELCNDVIAYSGIDEKSNILVEGFIVDLI